MRSGRLNVSVATWSETSYSSSLMTERYRSPDERAAGSGPQPQLTYRGPIPGTTEVLLIRHGRSADVVPGTPESSDPGLHEIGRAQAHALAKRLESKQIDGVYASHLARAIETARPLADARRLPVNVIEDLQEVLLGDWGEGEFRRRAAIGDPEFLAAMATGRWDAIPGAERDEDLRARVTTTVLGLRTAHVDQTIAVVSHGARSTRASPGCSRSTARTSRRSRTQASRRSTCGGRAGAAHHDERLQPHLRPRGRAARLTVRG